MSYPKVSEFPGVEVHPEGNYPFIRRRRGGKYEGRTSKRRLGRRPWERGDIRWRDLAAKGRL